MLSVAHKAAAPATGAASRRKHWHDAEREDLEVPLFGGRQYSIATALYCVEWRREYGPDPDDYRGYLVPEVQLVDLITAEGRSIKNAAGAAECRRIAEQLEEYEYESGPPEPRHSPYHYD